MKGTTLKLIVEMDTLDAKKVIKSGSLARLFDDLNLQDVEVSTEKHNGEGDFVLGNTTEATLQANWTPGGGDKDDSIPIKTEPETVANQVPTSAPTYSHDDLAKAAITLMDIGKQPELLGLLKEFGVQAVPYLPKEKLGAFALRLREMGAKI